MGNISAYLLQISAAAIICALVKRMLTGQGTAATVGKILCGMFLLFTILQPVVNVSVSGLRDFSLEYEQEAANAISAGEKIAQEKYRDIISQQISAYILDKAAVYDADLSVRVELSDDAVPKPVRLYLQGNISPYGKRQLQAMIANDLGIAKEDQIWT